MWKKIEKFANKKKRKTPKNSCQNEKPKKKRKRENRPKPALSAHYGAIISRYYGRPTNIIYGGFPPSKKGVWENKVVENEAENREKSGKIGKSRK